MKRMLCNYRLWLLMTVALVGSLSLSAQEALPRPASDFLDLQRGVTEAELVTRALASKPALLAQRQQIAVARGDVTQARLRQNPSLTLGGLKEVNGGDNAINVKGSLPLELFGRRARRTEVAENKEEATQQSVADRERLLTGEVRMRFGQALAAIRDLRFVEQLLQVNRDFLRLMEDRAREGAVPSLDADEIRVEANRVETLRIDYQAKAEVGLLALKETVGIDPEETIRLKGALELPPQHYDRKELLQLAMDHRPDLAFQRANEALAHAELRSDRAKGKPDASVFGGYERPDFGFSQRAFDAAGNLAPIRQTFNHVVFGLDINLPVFNRNQGAVMADTAAIQAARSQIAAVDLNLRHEVAQNLIRFIAAQRRYIDIETGYTNILLDAYAARIALEQAVGTNLP